MPGIMNLGRACQRAGVRVSANAMAGSPENTRNLHRVTSCFRVEAGGVEHTVSLGGRLWMTLLKLVAAAGRGVTALDFPAGARVAHYVWKLRAAGVPITTEHEAHGGEYPGRYTRYRLAPGVRVRAELGR